jgi:hypothetical protein
MPTSYTSLLGLALPVTGELSGTWGDTVNNYITSYVDASVAGTQTISTDGNVTLTVTNGTSLGSTSAQYMILNCTGARTAARTITVPASSRHYIVINGTTGGFAVNVVGAGPTTGVSVANGERCIIAWNGSDYVKVSTSTGTGDVTAAGNNAFTGANTFYNATGQTFGTGTSTQDGIIIAGRAGGSSSYRVTLTPTTLTASRTLTLPNVTDTVATIGTAQTFTAAQTFRAASAIRSEAASTQDAVVIAGRAGGTSSYAVTLTPTTLSASRTVTLPDANTTIPVATQVLTFSGPTAARTITLPDENFTVGFRNLPAVGTKTGSYTLAVGDVGKYVQLSTGGAIVIPTSTFAEGDAITLYNNTTGSITITCSAPTAYIAGTNTVKTSMTLATRGVATILFYSATACVVTGNVT